MSHRGTKEDRNKNIENVEDFPTKRVGRRIQDERNWFSAKMNVDYKGEDPKEVIRYEKNIHSPTNRIKDKRWSMLLGKPRRIWNSLQDNRNSLVEDRSLDLEDKKLEEFSLTKDVKVSHEGIKGDEEIEGQHSDAM